MKKAPNSCVYLEWLRFALPPEVFLAARVWTCTHAPSHREYLVLGNPPPCQSHVQAPRMNVLYAIHRETRRKPRGTQQRVIRVGSAS